MKKLINIYCDMDGVLADFNAEPNAVERFAVEKDFFKNLRPLKKNVKALKRAIKKYNVYILSASPNKNADNDKIAWLKNQKIKLANDHIILCRNGEKKVDFIKSENGILLDDYGKNIREWVADNGSNVGYKIKGDGAIAKGLREMRKLGLI